ncbi:MAG TPA: hypothetical protein VGM44_06725 [Polyangiaceae bacterium]|jgi:hypothetical protein
MPDPVSSLSSNPSPNACIDDDGVSANECTAPPTPTSTSASQSLISEPEPDTGSTPNAVKTLIAQFTPRRPGLANGAAIGRDSNAVGYSYDGPTPDGDSHRSVKAFVKTTNDSGANLEVLGMSEQSGLDQDFELTTMRGSLALSHAGYGLSVSADALTARANLGEHNDDGSIGGNLGIGAEFIGAEATIDTPVGSLTAGASVSASVSGSLGVRDADHDGKPEFCAKFSIPAFTLGACLEQFW